MADHEIRRRGLMLVLSSPSGAGKTTISRRLLELDGNLTLSISATTRRPRPGEKPGRDYLFVDEDQFAAMVKDGELLEHAQVFGHQYGTPRQPVETALKSGQDVLFDIDWQGTQQLKERVREDLVSVFILPPSTQALEQRLTSRAQDSREVVAQRMAKAADEMSHYPEYDYIVVNRDIEDSVARVCAILSAERHRRARLIDLGEFVNRLRGGR